MSNADRDSDHEPYFLTIDQGGHASRALVFDQTGNLLAQASHPIITRRPQDHWVELEPRSVVDSIRCAIRTTMEQLGADAARVAAAGIATQRSNVVCWERGGGRPLSAIISWQDRRHHAWLETLNIYRDEIYNRTGLPLSAHYGASKLRWCLDNLPEVRRAQESHRLAWGPMISFLLYQILVEKPLLCDVGNASRSLLWDIRERGWSPVLHTYFGLPLDPLPAVTDTIHPFGNLCLTPVAIPLLVATGDQNAALFAHGPPDQDTLYITLGTGAFIHSVVGADPACHHGLLNTVVAGLRGETLFSIEGTVNGAGSALDWWAKTTGYQPTLVELESWCRDLKHPPLFINGISGLGTPFFVPEFDSFFLGRGDATGDYFVAVLESILFLLMLNLEQMRLATADRERRRIVVGGGISQVDAVCQKLANISRLPVERPGLHETTCRGLAELLRQAVASENNHDDTPGGVPGDTNTSIFAPMEDEALDQRYRRWHAALLDALDKDRR